MINFFEQNNIPYVMLFESPEISKIIQTTMTYTNNGEKYEEQATYESSCATENEDMEQFVRERRNDCFCYLLEKIPIIKHS